MPDDSRFETANLHADTLLVHGGGMRSSFGEMSEALFLTQGFAYDTMEAAEARFNGEDPGFIYSRFSNPTVAMFESRMALLEGAEAARATASGASVRICPAETSASMACEGRMPGLRVKAGSWRERPKGLSHPLAHRRPGANNR